MHIVGSKMFLNPQQTTRADVANAINHQTQASLIRVAKTQQTSQTSSCLAKVN